MGRWHQRHRGGSIDQPALLPSPVTINGGEFCDIDQYLVSMTLERPALITMQLIDVTAGNAVVATQDLELEQGPVQVQVNHAIELYQIYLVRVLVAGCEAVEFGPFTRD